jgi:hypothetical protein
MWGLEGTESTVGRGIKGIRGIFFFHFSGSRRSVGHTAWQRSRSENRNLLILNWLFGCRKIEWKFELFLRGYPRASPYSGEWLGLSQFRNLFWGGSKVR